MKIARRPGVLRPGDRVRFDAKVYTVVGLSGTLVLLADEAANTIDVRLADLLAKRDFEMVSQQARGSALASVGLLQRLPDKTAEQVMWWEGHLIEVIHGLPPDAPRDARPRPAYDPIATTLTQREQAKTAELVAAGHDVNVSLVKRRRQRYEAGGLAALVDHRLLRQPTRFGRTDTRIVEAMRTAVGEAKDASTRTGSYLIWRTKQILAQRSDAQ